MLTFYLFIIILSFSLAKHLKMFFQLSFLLLVFISLVCTYYSLPIIVSEKCGTTSCPNNGVGFYCYNTCQNGIRTQGCCPVGRLCINSCNICGNSICGAGQTCSFCSSDPGSSKCCAIGALCTNSNCSISSFTDTKDLNPNQKPEAIGTESNPTRNLVAKKTTISTNLRSSNPTIQRLSIQSKPTIPPKSSSSDQKPAVRIVVKAAAAVKPHLRA